MGGKGKSSTTHSSAGTSGGLDLHDRQPNSLSSKYSTSTKPQYSYSTAYYQSDQEERYDTDGILALL